VVPLPLAAGVLARLGDRSCAAAAAVVIADSTAAAISQLVFMRPP
jgi:hypothetical protein